MNIKLDENLPVSLVDVLTAFGHDVDTVPDEGLAGHDDATIWATAQTGGRFFITQDLDFSDVRRFLPGTHNGLLLVRVRVPSRSGLLKRIEAIFTGEQVETWERCFVLATDHKIRVHRP